ncbi:MAG: DNA primase family protein, partial [Thermomicrobiales bacterium]
MSDARVQNQYREAEETTPISLHAKDGEVIGQSALGAISQIPWAMSANPGRSVKVHGAPIIPVTAEDAYVGRNGLEVARLGSAVQRLCETRIGDDQRLYAYHQGVYRPDAHLEVARHLRALMGNAYRQRHVNEVLGWLAADEPTLAVDPDPSWLNLANGLLNWQTAELFEHTPAIPSTIQLAVAWRPEARCLRIQRFLQEVLPPDSVDFVLEIIGYALYAGNPLHKAVLLYGAGRNGKGTLLRVITALCGAANVSNVSLHQLQENRFAVAELLGKLVNSSGDLDSRAVRGSDVFKQLTGGDALYAERKHAQPFSFTPIALPIFSANQHPPSVDLSEGWFARWLVVPMERSFAGVEDPGLTAKLTSPDELSGLLNLAVVGLQRLMARGRFEPPPSSLAATKAYRGEIDTVSGFIMEQCLLDQQAQIKRSTLFEAYDRWCSREHQRSAS